MPEYFYLYNKGPENTLELIPEANMRSRWIRLRDIEGRLTTQTPIPSDGLTLSQSNVQEYEQKYQGKFLSFNEK